VMGISRLSSAALFKVSAAHYRRRVFLFSTTTIRELHRALRFDLEWTQCCGEDDYRWGSRQSPESVGDVV